MKDIYKIILVASVFVVFIYAVDPSILSVGSQAEATTLTINNSGSSFVGSTITVPYTVTIGFINLPGFTAPVSLSVYEDSSRTTLIKSQAGQIIFPPNAQSRGGTIQTDVLTSRSSVFIVVTATAFTTGSDTLTLTLPECPIGTVRVEGGTCEPIICPDGLHLEGSTCIIDDPIECPIGEVLNNSGICVPIICPDGTHLDGNSCVVDDDNIGGIGLLGNPIILILLIILIITVIAIVIIRKRK